ncbi:MAG: hypothetical protein Q7V88_09055 [Actinomycetota bacterium]|nr:hypothetical protein [Actinomycetota bacterium]
MNDTALNDTALNDTALNDMALNDMALNDTVAAQWAKGLAGDWAILAQLSSPTMRVWHSHDDMWLTREESIARMAAAAADAPAPPPSFEQVRTLATATGFVVQATVQGLGGQPGPTHIVQICTVVDGLIAACEEYIAPETSLG